MIKIANTSLYRTEGRTLLDITKLLLPQNKKEVFIFAIFFIFYLSYSLQIAIHSSILDWDQMWIDRYFSFDNPRIYHTGNLTLDAHPLLILFTYPILFIGNQLDLILNIHKGKTILFVFTSCYLVSSSILYVYRYMSRIIELKGYILYLLTVFYGFFFTNLILAFTIESFTYSTFFLTFFLFIYSDQIKRNKKSSFILDITTGIVLGGITITNLAKSFFLIAFTQIRMKFKIIRIFLISSLFIVLFVFLEVKYNAVEIMFGRFQVFSGLEYEKVGQKTPEYKYITDHFLGASVLSSDIVVTRGISEHLQGHLIIIADFYKEYWRYTFIGLLYSLVIASIVINIKNRYVQLIATLLSVDLIIHMILKFGINDSLIFGGHWVYSIPLLIGWLYKRSKNKIIFKVTVSALSVILILTNTAELCNFIQTAIAIFPLEH